MGFSFGGILRAMHNRQGLMSDDSEDTSPLSRRSALLGRRTELICIDSYFDTRCCFSSIVSSLSSGGFTKKRQLKMRLLVWGCGSLVQPVISELVSFFFITQRHTLPLIKSQSNLFYSFTGAGYFYEIKFENWIKKFNESIYGYTIYI